LIRHPQPLTTTLFPYTTLFRSPSKDDLAELKRKLGSELVIMDLTASPEEKSVCRELGITYDERTPLVPESGQPIPISRLKIVSSDRKSTRLNSSHVAISYAVFC